MSDKKKVLITYTTEEYQELLKQIPKGVPISRYIREKSLEKDVILNDIKTYKAFIYMGEEVYEFESDTLCQVLQLVDYFKRNHELWTDLIP